MVKHCCRAAKRKKRGCIHTKFHIKPFSLSSFRSGEPEDNLMESLIDECRTRSIKLKRKATIRGKTLTALLRGSLEAGEDRLEALRTRLDNLWWCSKSTEFHLVNEFSSIEDEFKAEKKRYALIAKIEGSDNEDDKREDREDLLEQLREIPSFLCNLKKFELEVVNEWLKKSKTKRTNARGAASRVRYRHKSNSRAWSKSSLTSSRKVKRPPASNTKLIESKELRTARDAMQQRLNEAIDREDALKGKQHSRV